MNEIVLGVGRKSSILDLADIFEKEIRRIWGAPRRLTCKTDQIEFVAERKSHGGDFDAFTIRIRSKGELAETLHSVAESHNETCVFTEDDGWQTFKTKNGPIPPESVNSVVDEISACMTLPEVWRVKGDRLRSDRISVETLFQAMAKYKASDLHLSPGSHPVFRVDNKTQFSELMDPPSAAQITALIREIAPEKDWKEFEDIGQTSFSFHQVGIGYARTSAFIKRDVPHVTFRFLPESIPTFDDLSIPRPTMEMLAKLHRGLVMVTGMTGSGKTTTLASIVDWINTNRAAHVLTIENPIEYVFSHKRAIISQREVGKDSGSFGVAAHGALRHDPDVIVIGEMRDPDTIRAAISAAATGHLVLTTIHSNSASEVVNRVVSFFDPVERDLVKLQLRDSLKCVMCQRLVPRKNGGRIPALEIMFNDIKPINDSIIAGDTDGIRIGMQQTTSHSFLFEEYLHNLVLEGIITLEDGQEFSTEQSLFDQIHMGTYSVPRLEGLKKH